MPTVTINLPAIRHNIGLCRKLIKPNVLLCQLLKCDAYGHGFQQVAASLAGEMPDCLAFEINEEACFMREHYPHTPLLRLYPVDGKQTREGTQWDIEETISTFDHAREVSEVGVATGRPVKVHIDVDTGMGRIGILYHEAADTIQQIASLPGIKVVGIMTHCPTADEPGDTFAKEQMQRFKTVLNELTQRGITGLKAHMAASASILVSSDYHFDMVRFGLAAYGCYPVDGYMDKIKLKPAMSWHTTVSCVRELPAGWTVGYGRTHLLKEKARIATLDLGYCHGYPRTFGAKAEVLLHGQRVSVVGRISMNLVTVDVTNMPEVKAGDEAVLMGRQGEEEITAHDLGRWGNTICNEILTMVGKQNKRIWVDE
jgi:alanine racemase